MCIGAGNIFGDYGNFDGRDGDFGSTMEDIEIPRALTRSNLDENKSKSIDSVVTDTMLCCCFFKFDAVNYRFLNLWMSLQEGWQK